MALSKLSTLWKRATARLCERLTKQEQSALNQLNKVRLIDAKLCANLACSTIHESMQCPNCGSPNWMWLAPCISEQERFQAWRRLNRQSTASA